MTRAEQPTGVAPAGPAADDALAAESREHAVRALLRHAPLRRLWSAQFTGGIGDVLSVLVLLLLALQAAVVVPLSGGPEVLGGGYRGVAFAVAAVFGVRLLATALFGAALLGPLAALTAPGGALDRRWTMIGADAFRSVALIIAPLWIDWTPDHAYAAVLVTVFVTGVAERLWTVAKDSAAPALLPAPPPEGAAVRPLPDHREALRRLSVRTGFLTFPIAAAALVAVTLVGNLLGSGIDWFADHQAALGSYVAAGLFAGSLSVLYFLELPDTETRRPRSPLEGLRRPKKGDAPDKGRTGAVPLLVLACAATAAAIAAAVALAPFQTADLGGGPVTFGLLVLGLTGGTVAGIRLAPRTFPALSRRRLLAVALAVTGIALLATGLTPDTATVIGLSFLSGLAAGVAAHTGHTLLDQEVEEFRRARTTEHLHAVVGLALGVSAVVAPVLAGLIGPHRMENGDFVFDHGGGAFALMLVGALLLPVAALVLGRTDDRQGVPLRTDLKAALSGSGSGAGDTAQATAANGFFIAVEGGDGAGKSTQAEVLAEWIRNKGHEVVVTREPGATPIGKRLRSILLDVSSAGLSDRAEALLYAADRAEHIDSVVRPALERGAVVISDRYIDSSVAYQGAGRELSPTEIARISRWATDGLVPHLTVLLDISPETARERFTEAPDRLESESTAFHQRVRSGFLTLAAADPARYLIVDAGQETEAVTTVVRHRLDQLLPLSEAEIKAVEEARKAAEEEARRKAEEEAARKAEEERLERERQEQIERLRREEQERKRREEELERQREEARKAEEARQRAEEARRVAEEERQRREAEEQARQDEQDRLRRLAEEQQRLRKEAEERRLEKQRKAEEALLRAEQARAAEAATRQEAQGGRQGGEQGGDNESTTQLPVYGGEGVQQVGTEQVPDAASGTGPARGHGHDLPDDSAQTVQIPQMDPAEQSPSERTQSQPRPDAPGQAPAAGADPDGQETTQLPSFGGPGGALGAPGAAPVAPEEETTVMPAVDPGAAAAPAAPGGAPEELARTAELPQVPEADAAPRPRPRPDWAEETPLDDMPTLADELLGPHGDGSWDDDRDGGDRTGGRGRGRRS
ncbi:dTMP kinase [Streptomyces phytohabitans]|uniref:dTMP kinase n=1 Tax=Streptomyces phytohabitans TaxID=1150371 RepID=UPI00345BB9A3